MGDRCYLELTIAKADLKKLEAIVGQVGTNDDGEEEGITTVIEEEVNYGWSDELNDLAEENVAFYGWHGEGGDYGSESFCGIGGKCFFMDTRHGDDVTQFDKGNPVDHSVRNARLFYEAHAAGERMVKKRARSKGGG